MDGVARPSLPKLNWSQSDGQARPHPDLLRKKCFIPTTLIRLRHVDSLAPARSALAGFRSANSFRRFPNGSSLPLPRAKDTGEGTRSNAVGLFGCGFGLSNATTFAARTEDLAVGATPYRRMKLQNLSVFIRVHLWFKIL
jgi:hypothetical protein